MICFFHRWSFERRESKKGDFISGYSPVFFYEKCEKCGKIRNDSPFSEELTERIEKLKIMGEKLMRSIEK